MNKCLALALVIFQAVFLIACAGGISKEARSRVTYTGSFAQLQQQPESYQGETVMWGGKVIETHVSDGSTELVMLQLALNSSNRPEDGSVSGGRFLVRANQFLDPVIFSSGTLVTVVGDVTGSTVMPIGQMDYRYPVIEPLEIKKWDPTTESSPRIHFGIGVGTHF
jgi:outer membrane lipoprotein